MDEKQGNLRRLVVMFPSAGPAQAANETNYRSALSIQQPSGY